MGAAVIEKGLGCGERIEARSHALTEGIARVDQGFGIVSVPTVHLSLEFDAPGRTSGHLRRDGEGHAGEDKGSVVGGVVAEVEGQGHPPAGDEVEGVAFGYRAGTHIDLAAMAAKGAGALADIGGDDGGISGLVWRLPDNCSRCMAIEREVRYLRLQRLLAVA